MEKNRAAAFKAGKKRYISDHVCPGGHIGSERHVSSGACIECKKMRRAGKKSNITPKIRAEIARRSHESKLKDTVLEWQSGVYIPRTNRTLRRLISSVDGYKCSSCGILEWNGRQIVLEVEHRDGNGENNSPENVCLICPNCHSQTSTYKGANRGNGRHYRRVRYAEGKSF